MCVIKVPTGEEVSQTCNSGLSIEYESCYHFLKLNFPDFINTIIRNTERDFRGFFYSPRPWIVTEPEG